MAKDKKYYFDPDEIIFFDGFAPWKSPHGDTILIMKVIGIPEAKSSKDADDSEKRKMKHFRAIYRLSGMVNEDPARRQRAIEDVNKFLGEKIEDILEILKKDGHIK